MESRSFGVVEHGRGDLHWNFATGHRHVQRLANPGATAAHERERDRTPEHGAVVRRM